MFVVERICVFSSTTRITNMLPTNPVTPISPKPPKTIGLTISSKPYVSFVAQSSVLFITLVSIAANCARCVYLNRRRAHSLRNQSFFFFVVGFLLLFNTFRIEDAAIHLNFTKIDFIAFAAAQTHTHSTHSRHIHTHTTQSISVQIYVTLCTVTHIPFSRLNKEETNTATSKQIKIRNKIGACVC